MDRASEIRTLLGKLVIYPRRACVREVRIPDGPRIVFERAPRTDDCYAVLRMYFPSGNELHLKAEIASGGKSLWLSGQTHRLAPAFIEKLTRGILRNPQGLPKADLPAQEG